MQLPPDLDIGKRYQTAVEIGRSYLKIAEAEFSKKGVKIARLITEPITGLSDEGISRILADIINANNIKLQRLTAVISRDRVMLRYLRLPAALPKEVEDMVSFEITKQAPYSQDEVISDYKVVETDSEGYSDIILTIAHRNETDRLNDILKPTGKAAEQVMLSSEAITAWLNLVARDELLQKNLCAIDIDTDTTEIAVICDGKLAFSRVASIGAANISQQEPEGHVWQKRLIAEIEGSIAMYIKEKGKAKADVSGFLVFGANSVIEKFSGMLQQETNLSCRHLNILSGLVLADSALTGKGVAADTSICGLCGSIFITEGINLVPEELRKKQKVQLRVRNIIGVSVSIGLILTLFFAVTLAKLYQRRYTLLRMGKWLKQIEAVAESTEEKIKRLRVIKQQSSEGASTLDALYHIYRLIPDDISLADFDYEQDSRVLRFRGTALRMSDVFKLATALEESDSFSNVQTRSVAKRRIREGEVVDFQISCNFTPEGR